MQWREVYMFAALWNAGYREPAYLKVAEDGFRTLFAKARRNDGSYHYLMTRDWQVSVLLLVILKVMYPSMDSRGLLLKGRSV
jgi:hypothetical protein